MFDEENVIYRYKYLPYTKGAIKTLVDGTIKFTCPLDFNDPFDCRPFYDITNINEVPRKRPELFKAAGDRRGLSPAKRLMEKGKFVSRLKTRVDGGGFAEELISNVGVVSLSKNPLNIPMWSHYADFHRGFVLEFRIPTTGTKRDVPLVLGRLLPFEITYEAKRPHIEIGLEDPQLLVNKLILTKSLDWKYEEEERVIDYERGPGIHPYNRDEILSSVIAGLDMNEANFKKLSSIVKKISRGTKLDLSLYKVEEVKDEYKLAVPSHPRLGENEH